MDQSLYTFSNFELKKKAFTFYFFPNFNQKDFLLYKDF